MSSLCYAFHECQAQKCGFYSVGNESPLNGSEQEQIMMAEGNPVVLRMIERRRLRLKEDSSTRKTLQEGALSWQPALLELNNGKYGSQFHVILEP